jgi:DNA-binding NarL/FixJ family response regulator
MVTKQIKQLEAAKANLARLQNAVSKHLQKELAGLPHAYGFDSLKAFFRAVTAAAGGKAAGSSGTARKAGGKKRRKRAVITDATRAAVKKLAEAGKSGAEIAKEVGISLPSVQNIKKALGLVKARK